MQIKSCSYYIHYIPGAGHVVAKAQYVGVLLGSVLLSIINLPI